MSDWDESISSPEAGQQAFHEAITPVQSSPSASERDEDDFNRSTSHDVVSDKEGSSDEDSLVAAAEVATHLVGKSPDSEGEKRTGESAFSYEDVEGNAFNDADKSSTAPREDDLMDRSDRLGEVPAQEDSSDGEEKGKDSRQVLECGYVIRLFPITSLS